MTFLKPPPRPPKFAGVGKSLEPKSFHARSWEQVLADCGYPVEVLVIDMETFFSDDYSMSDAGLTTIEYVQSPKFEILGCAFLPFGKESFFQVGGDMVETQIRCYQKQYGDDLQRCTVVMQNARFDALILSRKFNIHPPYLVDTLSLARHWNSRQKNDLATLAKKLGLPPKGETENFKGMTFRTRFVKPKGRSKGPKLPVQLPRATPEQVAKLAEYAIRDVDIEGEVFKRMLPKLSNPTTELRLMKHTLELWTRPVLKVDLVKGMELVNEFNEQINKAVIPTGMIREEISGNKSYEKSLVAALTEGGDDPRKYFKPCKAGVKLADAKDDPARFELLNHTWPRVKQLAQARAAIKSWPLHVARVQRIMRMGMADGGRLPVPLKYCGAHTARWSGGERVNLQNLGARGHDLVSAIRNMIVAPDGQTLVVVDASQIEARGLAYIAGQSDLCDAFAKGRDVYTEFGTDFFGVTVRKPRVGGIPAIEKLMKSRRGFSKIIILGCGYGMGKDRFKEYAESQGSDCSAEMAEKAVTAYRTKYPQIVQFWKDIEKAFLYTTKYKRSCSMPRGLRFDCIEDCDVVLTLPNGRELKYHNVKTEPGKYSDAIKIFNEMEKKWEYTWGGSLTENVVQAMSRDVLAEAFLRCEDLGIHTAFHCHDEVVAPVPDDQAEATMKTVIEEMARRPVWAPDFPLAAEGQLSKFYVK